MGVRSRATNASAAASCFVTAPSSLSAAFDHHPVPLLNVGDVEVGIVSFDLGTDVDVAGQALLTSLQLAGVARPLP